MAQINAPVNSPVAVTKTLELSGHCHGASRYMGSADISVSSGGFVGVLRRVDAWTPPSIYVVDVENVKRPHYVGRIALESGDPGRDRQVQAKVSHDGQWLCLYGDRDIWLQGMKPGGVAVAPVKIKTYNMDIKFVTWTAQTAIAVITEDSTVSFLNPTTASYACPTLPDRNTYIPASQMIAFATAGPWSVSTGVRFEKERPIGTLNILHSSDCSDVKGHGLPGFAGAFTPAVLDGGDEKPKKDSNQTFIYADVGDDGQSLRIAAMEASETLAVNGVKQNVKWKVDFRYPRSHDLTSPDIPIALYVSTIGNVFFVLTTLGYAHVFQVTNGTHMGSSRISTYRIAGSALNPGHLGLIVVDANGSVFKIALDINGWLYRLNLSSATIPARLQALRCVLQNNIPIHKGLFFQFFPNFITSNGDAYYDAVEVLEPLPGEDLYKFFMLTLKKEPSLLAVLRMLAKRFSEKIPLSDLTRLFKSHGGAAGVLPFLNAVGPANLTGADLAVYVEASVELSLFNPLEKFLLEGRVADPDAVQRVMIPLIKSDMAMKVLFEKFCLRFNLVEGLVMSYLNKGFSQLAAIKKLIEQSDLPRVLLIFKTLFASSVSDGLLDAFLSVAKATVITPELMNLYRENNKLKNYTKQLELIVAQSGSNGSLFDQLLALYDERPDGAQSAEAFFKRIGTTRCHELGWTVEDTDYALALVIYRIGQCDWPYITLSYKYGQNSGDIIDYILSRASRDLWTEVLAKEVQEPLTFKLGLLTNSFLTKLDAAPFPAVQALLTALIAARQPAVSLTILTHLTAENGSFQEPTERGTLDANWDGKRRKWYIENCYLSNLIINKAAYLDVEDDIQTFIEEHEHFSHVNIVIDMLRNKFRGPARFLVQRLLEDDPVEEVTDDDVVALTEAARKSDEKSVWTLIGNAHFQRERLAEAMEAYQQGLYHENYLTVLKALKNSDDFDDWNEAADYMKMVKGHVKDDKALLTHLSFALAKTNRMEEFQQLLSEAAGGDASSGDEHVCRICEDAPMEVNFMPCNHVCACVTCGQKVSNCPICRQPITARQRIFLS